MLEYVLGESPIIWGFFGGFCVYCLGALVMSAIDWYDRRNPPKDYEIFSPFEQFKPWHGTWNADKSVDCDCSMCDYRRKRG